MDDELYKLYKLKEELKAKKNKKINKNSIKKGASLIPFFNKLLITIVLTLAILIGLKNNSKLRTNFYKNVYDTNISFAFLNDLYEKNFGSPLPFKDLLENKTATVFNEKLKYSAQSKYKDGVKLTVDENYLVPIMETGIVVFLGEKEGYGKTVIVQQTDGLDVWYSNLNNYNVKLYDYVTKGNLLGEVNGTSLYLVYKKDGKVLDYDERL